MMEKPYGLTMRGIVKNDDGKILVLRRHPKSKTNPHKWELPGGKIEKCEFFDEALIREIREETGLDMDDIQELCSRVCVLGHGKLLFDGHLRDLLARYDTLHNAETKQQILIMPTWRAFISNEEDFLKRQEEKKLDNNQNTNKKKYRIKK